MTAIHPHYFTLMLEGNEGIQFARYVDHWCKAYSVADDAHALRYRTFEFTNVAEPVHTFTLSFADRAIAALFKLSWPGPALSIQSTKSPSS